MTTIELRQSLKEIPAPQAGIALRLRQVMAVFSVEFRRTLLSRRTFASYALALIPVAVFAISVWYAKISDERIFPSPQEGREIFGYVFSSLILGAVIYLGSASIFITLFRGEILDRSIHYYLLAPVRREVLVLAKFLAGLTSAFILFGTCTVACYVLLYLSFDSGQLITDLTSGIALSQLGSYLGITLLACMGYGSVFMAAGLVFRNPIIPVVLIAAWEFIHFVLPPALKIFSVIYYLKGLLPIPLDEGPLAIIVAPPPLWVSVAGMLGLCLAMLLVSAWILARLELKYSEE